MRGIERKLVAVEQVRAALDGDRLEIRIREDHLVETARCRVTGEGGLHVGVQLLACHRECFEKLRDHLLGARVGATGLVQAQAFANLILQPACDGIEAVAGDVA